MFFHLAFPSLLQELYQHYGCHHCGTRARGMVVGDHMPPNKLIKAQAKAWQQAPWLARRLLALLGQKPDLTQRFYPQCGACSSRQGGSIAGGASRALVMHRRWLDTPQAVAAIVVGVRGFASASASVSGGLRSPGGRASLGGAVRSASVKRIRSFLGWAANPLALSPLRLLPPPPAPLALPSPPLERLDQSADLFSCSHPLLLTGGPYTPRSATVAAAANANQGVRLRRPRGQARQQYDQNVFDEGRRAQGDMSRNAAELSPYVVTSPSEQRKSADPFKSVPVYKQSYNDLYSHAEAVEASSIAEQQQAAQWLRQRHSAAVAAAAKRPRRSQSMSEWDVTVSSSNRSTQSHPC